jgi:hypothetical protein
LAAALLGELVLSGHVGIRDGRVMVARSAAPADALGHAVLDHLISEPVNHPVRTWLAFLARTAHADVAVRMLRAGHLREQVSRRLWGRRAVRYVPTDMNTAAWPWARLSTLLRAGRALDAFDTVLGGLVLATDLHRAVLLGASVDLVADLRRVVAVAPPAVRDLIAHTEAAVGDAVITST